MPFFERKNTWFHICAIIKLLSVTELDMTEETAAVAAALKLMLALDFFFHVAMPFADYGDKTD